MKGLGKGLGALLSIYDEELEEKQPVEKKTTTPIASKSATVKEVVHAEQELDISLIDPNINQPRKDFNEAALRELADSIKLHGVIQPIVVNKIGSRYMIIAGERRFRASKMVGLTKIPAIIKQYTAKQIAEISIIENLQREDLNDIEVAKGIERLMREYKLTQEQVSVRLGKNRSTVANTLRLLSLPSEVIRLIEEGRLSAGHARCLVVLDSPEKQVKLATQSADQKMSVRDLENAVKNILNPVSKSKVSVSQSLELKSLVGNMQRVFATKVSALGNDQKGRIFIDYYTRDDLDRIDSLMKKLSK